jgi:hypothetical protein
MTSLSFDIGTNAKRRAHAVSIPLAPHAGMKKPGAVSRPGFTHQTQLWMMIEVSKIR